MLDCVERHSPGSESFEVLRPFSLPMRRGITAVRGCTDPRVLRDLELYWVLVHCNSERVDLYFPCFSVSCVRSGVTRLLTVGLHIYIVCFLSVIFLGTKVCVAFVLGSLICCFGRWAMVSKHLYVLTGFGMGVRVPHVFVHAHIYLQY